MNYLDSIIDALKHLNGVAHINEIREYIEVNNTLDYINTNPNWRDQISNSITTHSSNTKSYKHGQDIFYTNKLGSGYWGLKNYQSDNLELDEEAAENNQLYIEGSKKKVIVNAYERNPQAKKKCIDYYKKKHNGIVKCEICGFNFGQVYGTEFSEKIHVHHKKEISQIGAAYKVDPIKDLVPICPNCHLIAHSRKPAYSVKEIKKMLEENNG